MFHFPTKKPKFLYEIIQLFNYKKFYIKWFDFFVVKNAFIWNSFDLYLKNGVITFI